MSGRVFFADRSLRCEIDALRVQEYAKASGFAVDLSTLQWKGSDDESFVMAAAIDGRIVSTMRGELIDDPALLERKLECPWDFPMRLDFPVLLLSRAATLSSHRAEGLNLVLRYWFLRFAGFHGISAVIGTFVSGSPRENTLREMGYRFFENKLGWQQSTYRSLRPVSVVALDLNADGDRALRYCLDRVPEGIRKYSFLGEFPKPRIVRSL